MFQRVKQFSLSGDNQRSPVIVLFRRVTGWLFVGLGLAGVVAIILRHGFHLTIEEQSDVDGLYAVILYGFVFLFLLRLILADRPYDFLKTRRADVVLLFTILVHLLFPGTVSRMLVSVNPLLTPESVAALYLSITQVAVVLAVVPLFVRASRRILGMNIQPATILVGSFGGLILFGTALLSLPRATVASNLSLSDALFTATSAVCVTGLTVVDTATAFTPLGKVILLGLIQVGGIGIMTLTTVLGLVIGGRGNLREYATVQSLIGEESMTEIRRTLLTISMVTIVCEGAGAVFLYQSMPQDLGGAGLHRLFFAVFHSVSAFCNAGFTLTSENLAHPLLRNNTPFLSVIMTLVVVGGLGFPVLSNVGRAVWTRVRGWSIPGRVSTHSRIVLFMTILLLTGGALTLYALHGESVGGFASLFHSVVARTAGFNTVDMNALGSPALFLIMMLMWIGGSPASTAGGVKTTSIALAALNLRAIVTGNDHVELFRMSIDQTSIVRAFSTILLSFGFIFLLSFVLLFSDPFTLHQSLFEVVSAVGTVGLSTGITSSLSLAGKIAIIVGMFIGRIGFLSFVMSVTKRSARRRVEYPSEQVFVT